MLKEDQSTHFYKADPVLKSEKEVLAVVIWSAVGLAILCLQLYVICKWIGGPYFVPTNPGPDHLPDTMRLTLIAAQAGSVIFGSWFLWFFCIRPRWQSGKFNTVSLLVICWFGVWFWDPMLNYTSVNILYNAYAINFGSWTKGAMPGWISPNGNLLPEPILIQIFGYPPFCLGSALAMFWILRKLKVRWPQLNKLSLIAISLIAMTISDTLVETMYIYTGLYAYPAGIRTISIAAGTIHQLPLSTTFLVGVIQTMAVVLLLYRDDRGLSFVERGVDKLQSGPGRKILIRLLGLYGYTHLVIIYLYIVPSQWFAMQSDAFPQHLPSYLINNLCVYGKTEDQCPGPGIMLPRPTALGSIHTS